MIPLLLGITLAVQLGPITPNVPVREPQMAASGSTVMLAFGSGSAIYFASSADAGAKFSSPVKVAEVGSLPLTHHRGPRIAFSGGAIVITAVASKSAGHADGDLLAWRSGDGGRTWSHSQAVNDAPGAAIEGLHSLAADKKGNFYAVWLDTRGGHGKSLVGTRSIDGGQTWSKNARIYESPEGKICECCHPSVTTDAEGQIVVMWRNSLAGARDMYFARSSDGVKFSAAEKLGTGTWMLNACPMDGGGIVASSGKIVTAWRRGESVFLAEPGHAEKQIGEGKDVALALAGDKTYVMWTHGIAIESWTGGNVTVLSKTGAFPALLTLSQGGVLAAWEENGGIQIRRLP